VKTAGVTRPGTRPRPTGATAARHPAPNLDPDPPLPAAGPYYLAEHRAAELAVFKRNPKAAGARPRPFDAIVFREGIEPGKAIALVEAGDDDAVVEVGCGTLKAGSTLAATWGPANDRAAAGDHRRFGSPRFAMDYLALDPGDPLLADPDVRRAISLALDRTALAAPWNETPSDQLLPPSVRGSTPVDTPVAGRDLEGGGR
jgi:ABC-type transport system substrate-binding protein